MQSAFITTLPAIRPKSIYPFALSSNSKYRTSYTRHCIACAIPSELKSSSKSNTFSFSIQDEITIDAIEQTFRSLNAFTAADLAYVTYNSVDSPLLPPPSWKAVIQAFQHFQICGKALDRFALRFGIPNLLALHPGTVRSILTTLSDGLRIVPSALISLLTVRPDLLSLDATHVRAVVLTYRQAGLRPSDVRFVILKFPRILLLPPSRLRATLDCFIRPPVQLSRTYLRSLVRRVPWILSLDPILDITPSLTWLQQRQYPPAQYIMANPQILTTSADSLQDIYDFLNNEVMLRKTERESILRSYPLILTASIDHQLRPVYKFLTEELQMNQNTACNLLRAFPATFVIDVEERIKPVIAYFQSCGVRNVSRVVSRLPPILGLDVERDIKPKMNFLQNEVGLTILQILLFPGVFSYSLEDRIRPRTLFAKKFGFSFSRIGLSQVVSTTDKYFCKNVVKIDLSKYQEFKEKVNVKDRNETSNDESGQLLKDNFNEADSNESEEYLHNTTSSSENLGV